MHSESQGFKKKKKKSKAFLGQIIISMEVSTIGPGNGFCMYMDTMKSNGQKLLWDTHFSNHT